MSRSLPRVEAGYLSDPAAPSTYVPVDTPAWFAWLEHSATTRFAYALLDPARGYLVGSLSVRKERRQRGAHYWVAYRRGQGRLRKAYLGRSAVVGQARLQVAAQALCLHTKPPP